MAVDKLVDSTQLDADLTSVANAIRAKGGTSAQMAFPAGFVSAVQAIPTSGDPNPVASGENDVIFIDYDGTVRYSYTTAEFLALTEFPANPVQSGLVAQGWNWTLADAKEFVMEYKRLVIGQLYVTDDGKTRLYVTVPTGFLDIMVVFTQTVSEGVLVDYGDGTQPERFTGTEITTASAHTYASPGEYVITLLPDDGCTALLGLSSSYTVITGVSAADTRYRVKMLKKIEFGVRVRGINGYGCRYTGCETVSVSRTTTRFWSSSFAVSWLKALVLPPDVECYANTCCESNIRYVSVPKGFTKYDGLVSSCYGVMRLDMLPGVSTITSLATLSSCLHDTLIIPSTVTNIYGHRNFQKCFGLNSIHFKPSTPPVLQMSTNFEDLPTTCIIYVPQGKLNDYKTATNYPDPTVYTYMEE